MTTIESVLDIKDVIQKEEWKVFGVGGLPITRSEAQFMVDDFEMICSRGTSELESVRKSFKVKVFDVKNDSKKSEDILLDENVTEYINSFHEKKIAIYVLRASLNVEKTCKENGWVLIAEKSALFDRLDSRDFFFELLGRIGYSKNFEILDTEKFEERRVELFEKLGEKIVIQTFSSSGGRGTFFVEKNNWKKVFNENVFEEKQKIIATSFVKGSDIAITGCVTEKNGVLSGFARYQFVGVESIVSGKEYAEHSFCGNDWAIENEYSEEVQRQGEEFVQKIGNILREEGYRGIFGIDFIYNKEDNVLVPLEINPRLIGSFPAETQFEFLNRETPLIGFHLLEFLGIKYEITEKLRSRDRSSLAKNYSHVLLANFFGRDIEFEKELKGGVYRLGESGIEFVKDGFWAGDLNDTENEFVLTYGTPVAGSVYKKNNQLFRIIWGRSIQINDGHDIDFEAKKVINVVKKEAERRVIGK